MADAKLTLKLWRAHLVRFSAKELKLCLIHGKVQLTVSSPRQGWHWPLCRAAQGTSAAPPETASAHGCSFPQPETLPGLFQLYFPYFPMQKCDFPLSEQNKHKPYKLCRNQSWTGIISGGKQWDFLGSGDVFLISSIHLYCMNSEVLLSFQTFCPTEHSSTPWSISGRTAVVPSRALPAMGFLVPYQQEHQVRCSVRLLHPTFSS